MDGHGNVAVDVYFNWNLSIFAVYPDLMHARLGNIKLIPMKTALCGIAAYCIEKKSGQSEARRRKKYLHLP